MSRKIFLPENFWIRWFLHALIFILLIAGLHTCRHKITPEASRKDGDKYAQVTGVKRNMKRAERSYLRAAENGDAQAQYNIGIIYLGGCEIKKDQGAALEWLREAAEGYNITAQAELGRLYERDGEDQDFE